ncbi:MAG: DNA-3-methyladenine glycosylase family protein [Candidatus Binatia bacterium]
MRKATAAPAARLTPALLRAGTAHLRQADPRLGAVIEQVGACRLQPRGQIYRSLFRAVLYQQLAGAAAAAIEGRLRGHFAGTIPSPADFLRARPQSLRRTGVSGRKLSYLRDLATAFATGRLRPQRLARLTDEEIVAAVTTVHGIGEWTAHMLLIFSLGRPDVLPVGDYGVRKGIQRLYALRRFPQAGTLTRIAAPWRPYRSIASWYIWRSIDVRLPDRSGW